MKKIIAGMCVLVVVLPTAASAQWTIEESDKVAFPTDRSVLTIASLVSENGMLAWEYSCIYFENSRRFAETIELFALKPNQECCDSFASGSIRYGFDQRPMARRRWNSGGAWMAPHTPESATGLLNGMRRYNYLTVHVEKKAGSLTQPIQLGRNDRDA